MKYTENYNLKKPEAEDFYNVEDFNENMEVIDGELKNLEDNKVDKIPGKGLSTNDYTTEEKNKLAGIEAGANKYVHPSTHSADMIVENTNKRFVSDTEKATWNATKTEIEAAKKHSLIYLGESLEYGGNILVLTQDENFIYVGGGTTNKVFKLLNLVSLKN